MSRIKKTQNTHTVLKNVVLQLQISITHRKTDYCLRYVQLAHETEPCCVYCKSTLSDHTSLPAHNFMPEKCHKTTICIIQTAIPENP